jgi:transcriptional regulator with XRE-family HTH domain
MNSAQSTNTPGDLIRAVRKSHGLTLSDVSERTGLAVSTLSKLEKGQVSLSYDKLMLISKGLEVDMAELIDASSQPGGAMAAGGGGRRVIQRAGEGQLVETRSYRQLYMATELLNKRFTPILVELHARTMDEFVADFGGFIRHAGEEFTLVLEGEVEFHSDLYAPVRLKVGDSVYFDSEMGHAYLKASEGPCRILATCSPRGREEPILGAFVSASARLNVEQAASAPSTPATKRRSPLKQTSG